MTSSGACYSEAFQTYLQEFSYFFLTSEFYTFTRGLVILFPSIGLCILVFLLTAFFFSMPGIHIPFVSLTQSVYKSH